ncbi:glycosyltransferase family 1 protein [Xylariaceae sp. FL1019]|nr:glycosyltransferase family 1 protein [Xylariaceae sp. FL1019]
MATKPEEDATRRRVTRKIVRSREEGHHATLEFPDHLKHLRDDADEEVRPPTQGSHMFMNANQSVFGLIAAASSTVDFNDRFEGQSSDEDEGGRISKKGKEREQIAKTTILQKDSSSKEQDQQSNKHRRKLSDQLRRSLPQLPRLIKRPSSKHSSSSSRTQTPTVSESRDSQPVTHHDIIGSPSAGLQTLMDAPESDDEDRPATVMGRMLEARAEMSSRPSFDIEGQSKNQHAQGDELGPTVLARRLKEIFNFDHPEEVIEEYPCWLLQSVLLQGYLYITAKHICFYAYLPKKAQEVAKSGYLSKSGKRNPTYTRFWFRLKGDVLAYFHDTSNLYFPHGQIDLRYAISASVTDKEKDGTHFSVATHNRTYHFRADSAPSAKEWVKSLQRVIFRSHNDGDSVKIALPINCVMDVEDSQMIEFADTCKIRVLDDESYSIDEYFFSFFSFGKEAINVIKILVEDASHHKEKSPALSGESTSGVRESSASRTQTHEKVRTTLNAAPPHDMHDSFSRGSGDESFSISRQTGRRTFGIRNGSPRRSHSTNRSGSKTRRHVSPSQSGKRESTDSFVQSLEDPSSSGLMSSTEDPSGSQILRGSEVFHRPMAHRSRSSTRGTDAIKSPGRSLRKDKSGNSRHAHHAESTSHALDTGVGERPDREPTPTLQNLAKMSAYPLQRAGLFAKFLDQQGRQLSSLLATESMGYAEKVAGMWKGGQKHYHESPGLRVDDDLSGMEDDIEGQNATEMERFRTHFALPETEVLQATFFGFLNRVLPLYGKIYISDRNFCFRSLLPGTRTKLILPLKDIETADKVNGFRIRYSGLVVVIRGHEELFFEFSQVKVRDDCAVTLLHSLETMRYLRDTGMLEEEEHDEDDQALRENNALRDARLLEAADHELEMPRNCFDTTDSAPTILFDDPKASFLNFKPTKSMRITCLTIGSRGDVQPYIALCKGLLADGHQCRIVTHAEFRGWVESHGIEFAPVAGDPGELMRLCIENGTFTWAFLKEASSTFRNWLDELLASAYTACQGSDLLIESPSAMAGIHIAEALSIPYFRAFTMPWTRTRAYPHAFVVPDHKMGGSYNYVTYLMFENIFWKATAYQINRWRNKVLGLPNTSLEKMKVNKVPFLYNFSPAVVAPPIDFSDWIRVTGYWFLDEGHDWTPPDDLRDFINKARADKKKLVYVGFGSIIVSDPAKMTQEVIDGVLKADVRCILSKGWSARMKKDSGGETEQALPPEIFPIKSAPHDWLFSQIDAAVHHGGSGTTGASLRAGIPTIIRPFFGDQFFFGSRVEDLGVGIYLKRWGAASFTKALWEATHSERMIVKARVLGETIRKENGVNTAIQSIYRDMEYATTLIQSKTGKYTATDPNKDGGMSGEESEEEESWTFVDTHDDSELSSGKDAPVDSEVNLATGSPDLNLKLGGASMPKKATRPSS